MRGLRALSRKPQFARSRPEKLELGSLHLVILGTSLFSLGSYSTLPVGKSRSNKVSTFRSFHEQIVDPSSARVTATAPFPNRAIFALDTWLEVRQDRQKSGVFSLVAKRAYAPARKRSSSMELCADPNNTKLFRGHNGPSRVTLMPRR